MSTDKKIIIIGAGASGIAAACKLISHGFQNVLLLEAENRIGGRIHTIPFGANVLDIGAQWCHGEDGNVVYELARDKNLLSSCKFKWEIFDFIRSNGEMISQSISQKLCHLGLMAYESDDLKSERLAYNGSLGNFFAEKYFPAFKTAEFGDIDATLQRQVFDWFEKFVIMYTACDTWFEVSRRSYEMYVPCPGDPHLNWKDRGYCTVLDLLQNKEPGHVGPSQPNQIDIERNVLLNKLVTKITYNTRTKSSNRIKVQCSDGSHYLADHLICTVSLGVLKKFHLTLFEPCLPLPKINSIEGVGFGTVDKIFVELSESFWTDDWLGVSILWQPEQLKEIRADPVNGDWLEHIMGFYPISFQPNTLLAWISGAAARKMEQVSDADFNAGVRRILKMALLNCGNGTWQVKNVLRSQWGTNPHFLGSYSFPSLKGDAIGASASILAQPILDYDAQPIIQFAGEATHSQYHSTVHGAIESGWGEAQKLIDLYLKRSKL